MTEEEPNSIWVSSSASRLRGFRYSISVAQRALSLAQVCAPIYKLVFTNLGGEKRFAAAVARRLQSMGALTRGDRRAASGLDLSHSNLDSPLGRKSLRCSCALLACLSTACILNSTA